MCESVPPWGLVLASVCESVPPWGLVLASVWELVPPWGLVLASVCESVPPWGLVLASVCELVPPWGLVLASVCESVPPWGLVLASVCESVPPWGLVLSTRLRWEVAQVRRIPSYSPQGYMRAQRPMSRKPTIESCELPDAHCPPHSLSTHGLRAADVRYRRRRFPEASLPNSTLTFQGPGLRCRMEPSLGQIHPNRRYIWMHGPLQLGRSGEELRRLRNRR